MIKMLTVLEYVKANGLEYEVVHSGMDIKNLPKRLRGDKFRQYFECGNLVVCRLPEVFFFPLERIFVTRDGSILSDTSQNAIVQRGAAKALKKLEGKGQIQHIEGPIIAVGGSENYYHWCLNWMSKLFVISQIKSTTRARGMVLCGQPKDYKYKSIAAIPELSRMDLHFLRGNDPVRLTDVIVPTMYTNPIHNVPHIRWLSDLFSSCEESTAAKRLYVSRRDAPMNSRKVQNESEVEEILSGYGFESKTLSGLSISQQASLFANAEMIIAAHGAGLTNLIFASENSMVCELNTLDSYSNVFRSLGMLSGTKRYDMIRGRSLGNRGGNKSDMLVDVEKLKHMLTEVWKL